MGNLCNYSITSKYKSNDKKHLKKEIYTYSSLLQRVRNITNKYLNDATLFTFELWFVVLP